jgi:glycosyltransferase involved in cell wall biosynthesis/GT2 family glycosyltransferase/tetratricopeptide (TPR) repeat protein
MSKKAQKKAKGTKKASRTRRARPEVAIRGEFFAPTGMAKVNRELAVRLSAAACRVIAVPFDPVPEGFAADRRYGCIAGMVDPEPSRADVIVCHHGPENLTRPRGAKLVLMQAWEYGWLPRGWPELIEQGVDEVWCYSDYVRQVYRRSGVPQEKLKIVPLGVDTEQFSPSGPSLDLGRPDSFKFLWVGMASPRKGIDALLEAYTAEFGAFEDVVLVLKDLVLDPSYSAGFRERLKQTISEGKVAPILHMTDDLADGELPSLYRACDSFVLPFRSEGFCLTIPEAMACELPVICTASGPPADYCDDSNSYLVPSREVKIGPDWDIGVETINPPFWAEPDVGDLRRIMRTVYENPDRAKAVGKNARQTVSDRLSWDRTAEAALERILSLAGESRQLSVVSCQPPETERNAVGRKPQAVGSVVSCQLPVVSWGRGARARSPEHGARGADLSGLQSPVSRRQSAVGSRQSLPPKVSVIIPVCNGLEYTKEAIGSLRAEAGCEFELIVVDNASTDGTADWLKGQTDIRTITNSANLGFAAACNRGAREAAGEYIVFLNNDTVSLDGWLAKMVEFADDHRDAAIVGAKLLYPGTRVLQHAWIDFDASGIPDHVFRGTSADDPRIQTARQVPMVTGACMLVRKGVFRELGGFDEAYVNGVEDIDLCFAAREKGYKVYYCPSSVLYHHEGKTEGRFANVRHNLDRFFTKWQRASGRPAEPCPAKQGEPEVAQMATKRKQTKGKTAKKKLSAPSSQLSEAEGNAVGRKPQAVGSVVSWGKGARARSLEHGARGADLSSLQSPVSSRQSAVGGRQSHIAPLILEGGLFSHHSLAHVNREMLLELSKRGIRAGVIPFEDRRFEPESEPRYAALKPLLNNIPPDAGIFIRHRWPPDLGRPGGYKFVLMQPWEFGYLPEQWVQAIEAGVTEVWVYSRYLRDVYLRSGVPAEKIFTIPLGVAPEIFCPEGQGLDIETEKGCKFLYVGAAVARKGVDLLLEAYCEEFSPADDVALIIKDSTYSQIDSELFQSHVARMISSGDNPEIVYFHGDLLPSEMPNLYRSADAVVLPYRGEGFCLPAVEAMACGRAVIITGFGPSVDYASVERAYVLPYTVEKFRENSVLGYETAEPPFWAHPDKDALKAAMRAVLSNRDEARKRGQAAAEFVRANFTWERTADSICERLAALSEQIRADGALTQAQASIARPAQRPAAISLCMIVKDEEKFLPQCLDSVRGHVDEMIVVDTGSSDRTIQIAKDCGAQVHHFEWNDDFAAARAESFRHARGDWILWLDADEQLRAEDWPKIEAAISTEDENAYFLKIKNLQDAEGTIYFTHYLPRLFRRSGKLKIEGTIHEQVSLDNLTKDGHVGTLDAEITHYGYITELVHAREKVDRNIRILKAAIARDPDSAFCHYSLGGMYRDIRMYGEATSEFEKAEGLLKGTETFRPMLYNRWASAYEGAGDYERGAACAKKAIELASNHPESHYILAECFRKLGQTASAIKEYKAAIDCPESFTLGTVDETTRGYKSHCGLAMCYLALSKHAEAAREFEAALQQNPNLAEAWHGLGVARLNLEEMREKAREALMRASQLMPGNPEVWTNLGVWHGMGGDHAAAQEMFEKAKTYDPANPVILGNLAMAYLRQGDSARAEEILSESARLNATDFDTFVRLAEARTRAEKHAEAIQALERAVEINPRSPTAWTNIAACYLRQGHTASAEVALRTALEIDPANAEAAQILSNIRRQAPAGPQSKAA